MDASTIVVTGATGNVGTAVLRALQRAPEVGEVRAVARRRPAGGARDGKITWVAADIGTADLGPVMAGADAVIHLAWRFHPTRDATDTWSDNVLGSLRTFDAAAAAGVGALLHASSVGAYSPADPAAPDEPVDETWPTHALPSAAYGRQKSYLERSLDAFEAQHSDIRVVRIRSAFVFQRSAAPEQRRIFAGPFVPGRLLASGRLPVVPVPRGLRFQTVHADDLAMAYVRAATQPVRGAFNVAAEPVIGIAELGDVLGAHVVEVPRRLVRSAMAAAFRLHVIPPEPGLLDLFLSLPVMDASRARHELGWQPRWTAPGALGEFLAGLRRPAGGETPPLEAAAGGRLRLGEIATGVGGSDGVEPS